jgi:hypothetical protein
LMDLGKDQWIYVDEIHVHLVHLSQAWVYSTYIYI